MYLVDVCTSRYDIALSVPMSHVWEADEHQSPCHCYRTAESEEGYQGLFWLTVFSQNTVRLSFGVFFPPFIKIFRNQVTWLLLIMYHKSLNKYPAGYIYDFYEYSFSPYLVEGFSVHWKWLPRFLISLQLVAMATHRAMPFRPTWKVREDFLKNWPLNWILRD